MTENSTTWQKYESKGSKKKNVKPNNASGDPSKSPKASNGKAAKSPLNVAVSVNNIFDGFIEEGDGRKPTGGHSGMKNGKLPSKGKNGMSLISGDEILKNGSVKSKFGETISFITSTASSEVSKLTSKNAKKTNNDKQSSYSINLSMLKSDPITEEIESLKETDQDKRCLSLAVFLNIQKAHQDVSGWETKSFSSNEPLNSLPKPVEAVLTKFIKSLPESSVSPSFELVLAELLTKSQSSSATTWGYKVLLQLLGRIHPELAILKNHKNLSRLFANSLSCGGSNRAYAIVWALMQPLCIDPVIGMRIWCKILMPHISNKSLASIICTPLDHLMNVDSLVLSNESLSHYDYFHLLDYTYPQIGLHNIVDPKTLKVLQGYYPKFKSMASITANVANFFSSFLMRYKPNQSAEMKDELIDCLALCLRTNSKCCYEMWFAMLDNYREQSCDFLVDLVARWDDVPEIPKKDFNKFLDRVVYSLAKSENSEDVDFVATIKQCKEQVSKPRKRVTFNSNGTVRGRSGGSCVGGCCSGIFSFFFSPFFILITLVALGAIVELNMMGNESYTKYSIDIVVKKNQEATVWLNSNYPNQMAYINDLYKSTQSKVAHFASVAYIKVYATLDFVYKDGPLRLYKYMEREIFPGLNKFYKKNMEKSLRSMSQSINAVVNSAMSKVSFDFIKPYLK